MQKLWSRLRAKQRHNYANFNKNRSDKRCTKRLVDQVLRQEELVQQSLVKLLRQEELV